MWFSFRTLQFAEYAHLLTFRLRFSFRIQLHWPPNFARALNSNVPIIESNTSHVTFFWICDGVVFSTYENILASLEKWFLVKSSCKRVINDEIYVQHLYKMAIINAQLHRHNVELSRLSLSSSSSSSLSAMQMYGNDGNVLVWSHIFNRINRCMGSTRFE